MTFSKQGELVQFLSAGDAKINSCKVHFSPKQAGTGDPSPENVREISGYNGVEVYHCGKNLLPSLDDTTYWKNGYFNSNGVGNTRADYRQSKQLVYIRAGQYVFSHLNKYVWIGIYVRDEHANKIYFNQSQYNFTVNIPTDGYAKFYVQNIQDCQLELGSTATKYEPYTGTTYNLDWTDTLGTLYGGYVDLISGEVVEEWGIIASYNGESLASEWLSDRDVYASGTTPTTGAQVAYPLATPITHQLTPSQLTTLTNQNTFWSNADRIEIEYDLIETRQIEMARRNIIMNSPHVESVTGSNASFITDMASKLKECKIHFTPIQEGSGDPSPDNVRPIHGWDGVTVTRCGKNLFANQKGSKSYIGLKAGVTYTISYRADGNAYFRGINENGSYITNIIWMNTGVINERRYGRITPSIDIPYGVIYRSAGLSEAQIEVGSEATSYEPYESTTLTIPFPKTIYGGYVDLVKGEVVETQQKIIVDSETNLLSLGDRSNASNATHRYINVPNTGVTMATNYGVSNMFTLTHNVIWYNPGSRDSWSFGSNNTALHFVFDNSAVGINSDDSDVDRTTAIKEWLVNNQITFVIPLAVYTTYPLDPVAIRTLRGMNNIFSSANGDIEITYWTH